MNHNIVARSSPVGGGLVMFYDCLKKKWIISISNNVANQMQFDFKADALKAFDLLRCEYS